MKHKSYLFVVAVVVVVVFVVVVVEVVVAVVCCSHINSHIQSPWSLVTGQAPVTLEWKNIAGAK